MWNERAEQAQKDLVSLFWNENTQMMNAIYPLDANNPKNRFHYWWQAHVLDVLLDGYERTQDIKYLERFEQVYENVYMLNGFSIVNEFYDDMEWMALALLRAYQITDKEAYKEAVFLLWDTIKLGWNNHYGGGISWKVDTPEYKNTPANMPAAILAARLYKEFNDEADLQWGIKIFDWQNEHLVDSETGIIWDGINRLGDGKIDKDWRFTYCQGVYIGASLELYKVTDEKKYLQYAHKTADAAMNLLVNPDTGVLIGEGDGDGGLFKGIFIRYFSMLIQTEPKTKYINFVYLNGESLWERGRAQNNGLFSKDWYTLPEESEDLSIQLSGIMLTEQLAKLESFKIYKIAE
ncbi:MAG: AGE family epimerase/isomerase [Proteobacteria bacterium]|nr:AGE family epimerase/isomerase [Pseudomonadota bacterium]